MLELRYRWQEMPKEVTVLADSDWAGCRRTRRSTSGGAIVLGGRLVKHWSRTHASVALSSAEAELVSMVKGCCEVIGVRDMVKGPYLAGGVVLEQYCGSRYRQQAGQGAA